ncbi:MAG: histidine kinase [Eubacteriales bacterium]
MKNLKELSITRQFLFIIVLAMVFSVFMLFYVFVKLQNLSIENVKTFAQIEVSELNTRVVELYNMVDSICVAIQFDEVMLNMLENPYTSEFYSQVKSSNTKMTGFKSANSYVMDIALVGERMKWSSYLSREILEEFHNRVENIYLWENLGNLGYEYRGMHSTIVRTPSTLVIGRPIYSIYPNIARKRIGTSVISIDIEEAIDNPYSEELDHTFYLLNADKELIFPYNENGEGSIIDKSVQEWIGEEESFYIEIDAHLVYITYLAELNMYTVSCFNTGNMKSGMMKTIFSIAIAIAIIFTVLTIFMIIALLYIVQPINRFYKYIQQVKDNDFLLPDSRVALSGCQEINSINAIFNEVINKKDELSKELNETTVCMYETELGRSRAELEFLNSQINPHFLYNTLEMIRNIAIESNVEEIPAITTAMAKLFRYNIKGEDLVSLSKELEIAKAYLDIQSTRYKNRFDLVYGVREITLPILVPKLILQPLIENAILHGLEPKTEEGVLFISSKLKEDVLIIVVQDDGVGMSVDRLQEIQNALNAVEGNENKKYIGLLNVEKRIKLHYGNNAKIVIISELGSGTKVSIILPIRKGIKTNV